MSAAAGHEPQGLQTTENAENHEDFTSLKKSLSGIANSHAHHAEQTKTQGASSPKASQHSKPNINQQQLPEIALAALQYLPMPLLVLSSLKTVILANEAMGRLLGLHRNTAVAEVESVIDVLEGQTLSQIGIDMFQDGMLLRFGVT